MIKDTLKNKKRYELIDSIRGFAIINMVIFHTLYDIFMIYGDGSFFTSPWCAVWERFICVSFIIISGVSFNFSLHTVRNGIIVSLCGFLVTIVTALAAGTGCMVWHTQSFRYINADLLGTEKFNKCRSSCFRSNSKFFSLCRYLRSAKRIHRISKRIYF